MDDLNSQQFRDGGSKNFGDPTDRTNASILREISALKELFLIKFESYDKAILVLQSIADRSPTIKEVHVEVSQKIEALALSLDLTRDVIETRFNGVDARFQQLHREFDKVPEQTKVFTDNLEKLTQEKFDSIQVQFKERDVRVEQTARDTKVAVDAALQAAEKARTSSNESFALSIAKSENATTKQIDQTAAQMGTSMGSSALQIADLKERLTRIEGTGIGAAANKTDNRLLFGVLIAAVGMIIGIIGLIIKLN